MLLDVGRYLPSLNHFGFLESETTGGLEAAAESGCAEVEGAGPGAPRPMLLEVLPLHTDNYLLVF